MLVLFGTGAGDDHEGDYQVRAIFSNAFTVIPGEDVKISGVKVGKIAALDVTPDHKAAVVLDITEPGFKDFRKDATCTIRPQSLIGERFVECTPTQPRAGGDAGAAALHQIEAGAGKGEYLLPDSQTIKPVDLDLVGNIMRLPYRQRLSIIINELGTGLAANGAQLRAAVKEANPALEETDKVLKILADQNQTLAQLAKNSDEVLRPLARDKAHVANFIDKADQTAVASAQRRSDIEASLQKLPAFLTQLKPTMQRLGGLADQMTPVLTDLNAAAPQINQVIKQLGPFSAAATPALTSLGEAADVGDQALIKAKPIVTDLGAFAGQAKPTVKNLDALLSSLKSHGRHRAADGLPVLLGRRRPMAMTRSATTCARLRPDACTTYSTEPTPGCSSQLPRRRRRRPRGTPADRRPPARRLRAAVKDARPPTRRGSGARAKSDLPATSLAQAAVRARTRLPERRRRRRARRRAAEAPTGAAAARRPARRDATTTLLDYLLGADAARLAIHRRQPRADRRGDHAGRARRRLPGLQRQQRPAVRPDLLAHRRRPQRGEPRPGQRVRIGGTRVGVVDEITPKRLAYGKVIAQLHLKLETARQAAAGRLDDPGPVALGAGPEVRRAHEGHVDRRLRRGRDDPAQGGDPRARSSSTSSSARSTRRRGSPPRSSWRALATRSPAVARISTRRSSR